MNTVNSKKIGLALSGGGIRAAAFHLGVLKYLAERNLLESIHCISTVSGGSLVAGLIYGLNGNKWPTSSQFLNDIYPKAKKYITRKDLFWLSIFNALHPCRFHWLFGQRIKLIIFTLEKNWGITGTLQNLPDHPLWFINATTSESGKNWRFSKQKMGDYLVNYVLKPEFQLSHALAVSAAFPGGVGRYVLNAKDWRWYSYENTRIFSKEDKNFPSVPFKPQFDRYHLSDGGLYDNLGTEAMIEDVDGPLRDEIDFIVISDAGTFLNVKRGSPVLYFWSRTLRMIDIIYDQIRLLRTRVYFSNFRNSRMDGVLIQFGQKHEQVIRSAARSGYQYSQYPKNEYLSDDEIKNILPYPTDLFRMSLKNFELISSNGWQSSKMLFELKYGKDI